MACGAPFKDDFPVLGIEKVTKSFLDDLKREGKTLRHMMLFKRTNNRAALGVAPVVLPLESLEAQVRSNFNCVTLEGDLVGRLSFTVRAPAASRPPMRSCRTSQAFEHGGSSRFPSRRPPSMTRGCFAEPGLPPTGFCPTAPSKNSPVLPAKPANS